ncbi:YeeE/YedE family protein [Oceanicella actignis]|uniref:Uncharacterized protein n=1 Tax=Oceanicella actignis TaxID=1189325 RepID=A0A1M7SEL2_9RHOB|nr:YeeE/YedE family protein [Oceanicella actignis]SET23346.1 hypothetical protein SAMN04488119_103200 [Oceanicella actignis]SHN56910.1 hypothetical protein SAMN05216200_102308 [Oceanicella actignis]
MSRTPPPEGAARTEAPKDAPAGAPVASRRGAPASDPVVAPAATPAAGPAANAASGSAAIPAEKPAAGPAPPVDARALAAALALLALLAARAHAERGAPLVWAALLGAFAGLALHHARFGFASAWRRMTRERRGAGLRAQMLLIGLTCAASYPLMQWGAQIGLPARGHVLPIGAASAIGAFMFGAGMQLGGGCASGTLHALGGGAPRMAITLAFFVGGSVLATAHWDFWSALPRTRAGASLPQMMGALPALAVTLALLGAIALASAALERRRHGALEPPSRAGDPLRGPWTPGMGAAALALVGIGCFLALGRPWGVTSAFALWGAKALNAAGLPVQEWTYWSGWRRGALEASVFADATSVMNFGIVLGAMAAAALAGRWGGGARPDLRGALTAAAGGLLMGYGARLAYGCNIGAYLGGLASGSAHGWWWLIWGWAGSALGTRLRARLGMDPPACPPRA